MDEFQNSKHYDLEERTFLFAKRCRDIVKKLQRTIGNIEDAKQLIRSSGSQAANYIEANESLGKKDFCMRIKLCRKEAKESRLWLRLFDVGSDVEIVKVIDWLMQEAMELTKIFGSILEKKCR